MTVFRTKTFRTSNPRILESSNPARSRKQSGFTLLELIIVILLILLIFGFVVVYFANLLISVRLQTTVREFSTTLRQARSLAKIKGEKQEVTIDLDAREYGIEGRKTRKFPPDLGVKIIDSTTGEIQSGRYHLIFEPNWNMESATFQLFTKKKTFSIRLDPLMGTFITK